MNDKWNSAVKQWNFLVENPQSRHSLTYKIQQSIVADDGTTLFHQSFLGFYFYLLSTRVAVLELDVGAL